MILINPSVQVWAQQRSNDPIHDMFAHIEKCAQVCYKFEDKGNITSENFVKDLIKRKHMRPLEFGTCILKINHPEWKAISKNHPWIKCIENGAGNYGTYVTNLRFVVESFKSSWEDVIRTCWWQDNKYSLNIIRPTLCWHVDKITADLFRAHVCLSSLDKVGLEYCKPCWYDSLNAMEKQCLDQGLSEAEQIYLHLCELGLAPQQAKSVLPLLTATRLVQTGFVPMWKHFFNEHTGQTAHPDARFIAKQGEEMLECLLFNNTNNN